jgi:hypothetical protein
MKKPSTRILEIIDNAEQLIDGAIQLSYPEIVEIRKLTKAIDRRDQQMRKGVKLQAKKPARRAARR